jgi:hypothetical protein
MSGLPASNRDLIVGADELAEKVPSTFKSSSSGLLCCPAIHAVDLTMTAFCTCISAKLQAVVLGVRRHEFADHCSRTDSAKRRCHSRKPLFRCHRLLSSELYLAHCPRSVVCSRLRKPPVLFARNVPGHSRTNLPNVRDRCDCHSGFVCTGARISRTSSIGY